MPLALHKDGLPRRAFAYAPTDDPATWALPYLTADGMPDEDRLPMAADALSEGGFRGLRAAIPDDEAPGVRARLRQAFRRADLDPPESVRESNPVDEAIADELFALREFDETKIRRDGQGEFTTKAGGANDEDGKKNEVAAPIVQRLASLFGAPLGRMNSPEGRAAIKEMKAALAEREANGGEWTEEARRQIISARTFLATGERPSDQALDRAIAGKASGAVSWSDRKGGETYSGADKKRLAAREAAADDDELTMTDEEIDAVLDFQDARDLREAAGNPELSFDQVTERIGAALRDRHPSTPGLYAVDPWPRAVYDDRVIYARADRMYEAAYTLQGEGVELGPSRRVIERRQFLPVAEAAVEVAEKKADDDGGHPYGAWTGGKASAGGHPGRAASKTQRVKDMADRVGPSNVGNLSNLKGDRGEGQKPSTQAAVAKAIRSDGLTPERGAFIDKARADYTARTGRPHQPGSGMTYDERVKAGELTKADIAKYGTPPGYRDAQRAKAAAGQEAAKAQLAARDAAGIKAADHAFNRRTGKEGEIGSHARGQAVSDRISAVPKGTPITVSHIDENGQRTTTTGTLTSKSGRAPGSGGMPGSLGTGFTVTGAQGDTHVIAYHQVHSVRAGAAAKGQQNDLARQSQARAAAAAKTERPVDAANRAAGGKAEAARAAYVKNPTEANRAAWQKADAESGAASTAAVRGGGKTVGPSPTPGGPRPGNGSAGAADSLGNRHMPETKAQADARIRDSVNAKVPTATPKAEHPLDAANRSAGGKAEAARAAYTANPTAANKAAWQKADAEASTASTAAVRGPRTAAGKSLSGAPGTDLAAQQAQARAANLAAIRSQPGITNPATLGAMDKGDRAIASANAATTTTGGATRFSKANGSLGTPAREGAVRDRVGGLSTGTQVTVQHTDANGYRTTSTGVLTAKGSSAFGRNGELGKPGTAMTLRDANGRAINVPYKNVHSVKAGTTGHATSVPKAGSRGEIPKGERVMDRAQARAGATERAPKAAPYSQAAHQKAIDQQAAAQMAHAANPTAANRDALRVANERVSAMDRHPSSMAPGQSVQKPLTGAALAKQEGAKRRAADEAMGRAPAPKATQDRYAAARASSADQQRGTATPIKNAPVKATPAAPPSTGPAPKVPPRGPSPFANPSPEQQQVISAIRNPGAMGPGTRWAPGTPMAKANPVGQPKAPTTGPKSFTGTSKAPTSRPSAGTPAGGSTPPAGTQGKMNGMTAPAGHGFIRNGDSVEVYGAHGARPGDSRLVGTVSAGGYADRPSYLARHEPSGRSMSFSSSQDAANFAATGSTMPIAGTGGQKAAAAAGRVKGAPKAAPKLSAQSAISKARGETYGIVRMNRAGMPVYGYGARGDLINPGTGRRYRESAMAGRP